ncbi:sulfotransferase [Pelagicoccus sp. SDUM812003]|uniref:sulfotransferase family protein n=1 Tax=Pelagicoccus sp. SDUM812003 TaxID=3041267 RepID=UPI00280E6930|nr:sulfotransferase [Pelagicoccus sp. SDUM812003]MDQ8202369.1 sulfotransferase [Pelagicoccus sp. SDUM812003]
MKIVSLIASFLRGVVETSLGAFYFLLHGKPRLVIILSHTRSGSSLLANLICSHPKVIGFGEAWIDYRTPVSILRLIGRTRLTTGSYKPSINIYLDKCLHKQITDSLRPFRICHPHFLFLTREPHATTKSIVAMCKTFDENKGQETDYANTYLAGRLMDLKRISLLVPPDSATHLSYESLIQNPDTTLARLTEVLQLASPLSSSYHVTKTVGVRRVGDFSDNIRSGQIVSSNATPSPSESLATDLTIQAYRDTLAHLRQRFTSISTDKPLNQ